jgi:hypothetical protein
MVQMFDFVGRVWPPDVSMCARKSVLMENRYQKKLDATRVRYRESK